MKNKVTLDLTMPAAERIKLLAELTKQARADKLAEAEKAKVEMSKAYFNMPKELKGRFANACGTRSQNEVIVELIERFTRQSERSKPTYPDRNKTADELPTRSESEAKSVGEAANTSWLDISQL